MVCNQTVRQSVTVVELNARRVCRKTPDLQNRTSMLNGLMQSLGSGQEGFDSSGELCILKDRLYLASLPAPPDAKDKTNFLTLSPKKYNMFHSARTTVLTTSVSDLKLGAI